MPKYICFDLVVKFSRRKYSVEEGNLRVAVKDDIIRQTEYTLRRITRLANNSELCPCYLCTQILQKQIRMYLKSPIQKNGKQHWKIKICRHFFRLLVCLYKIIRAWNYTKNVLNSD